MATEVVHAGCFNCGGGSDQPLLISKTIYRLITQKGELSHVPRSVALCRACEPLDEVDLRQTAGK
jgi:hypothetical protein